MPVVPITDLAFQKRENELVVATQGRAFYVLDELPAIRQITDQLRNEPIRLFQPKPAYRIGGGGGGGGGRRAPGGQNPAPGAVIYYWLEDKPSGEVTLEFLDSGGKLIRKVSSKQPEHAVEQAGFTEEEDEGPRRPAGATRATADAGLNRYVWNLRYPDATGFPGLIMWAGQLAGPQVVPGKYQVRLTANGKTETQSLEVKKDPRAPTTPQDFAAQLALLLQLRDKLSQANEGVVRIRDTKRQLEPYAKSDNKTVSEAAQGLTKRLAAVEEELYQTKNRSSQDPLNYPIKLNNKLAALAGTVGMTDVTPPKQSQMVFEDLATQTNAQLSRMERLLKDDLGAFNKLVRDQNVPAITVKTKSAGAESF